MPEREDVSIQRIIRSLQHYEPGFNTTPEVASQVFGDLVSQESVLSPKFPSRLNSFRKRGSSFSITTYMITTGSEEVVDAQFKAINDALEAPVPLDFTNAKRIKQLYGILAVGDLSINLRASAHDLGFDVSKSVNSQEMKKYDDISGDKVLELADELSVAGELGPAEFFEAIDSIYTLNDQNVSLFRASDSLIYDVIEATGPIVTARQSAQDFVETLNSFGSLDSNRAKDIAFDYLGNIGNHLLQGKGHPEQEDLEVSADSAIKLINHRYNSERVQRFEEMAKQKNEPFIKDRKTTLDSTLIQASIFSYLGSIMKGDQYFDLLNRIKDKARGDTKAQLTLLQTALVRKLDFNRNEVSTEEEEALRAGLDSFIDSLPKISDAVKDVATDRSPGMIYLIPGGRIHVSQLPIEKDGFIPIYGSILELEDFEKVPAPSFVEPVKPKPQKVLAKTMPVTIEGLKGVKAPQGEAGINALLSANLKVLESVHEVQVDQDLKMLSKAYDSSFNPLDQEIVYISSLNPLLARELGQLHIDAVNLSQSEMGTNTSFVFNPEIGRRVFGQDASIVLETLLQKDGMLEILGVDNNQYHPVLAFLQRIALRLVGKTHIPFDKNDSYHRELSSEVDQAVADYHKDRPLFLPKLGSVRPDAPLFPVQVPGTNFTLLRGPQN